MIQIKATTRSLKKIDSEYLTLVKGMCGHARIEKGHLYLGSYPTLMEALSATTCVNWFLQTTAFIPSKNTIISARKPT
jgi:hypothetical protein